MIELRPVAVYHGPSPVAKDPVVVVEMIATADAEAILAQAIPSVQSASQDWYLPPASVSDGPPGLVVAEFLTDWALQALTFVWGHLRAAGCARDAGTGRVLGWVGFHDPQVSLAALDLGARWLSAVAAGTAEQADWPAQRDELWQRCRERHPDYQAGIVMQAAEARGIPYAPAWGLGRFWRFGQGERSRVLFESSSSDDSRFGSSVAASKAMTKTVLNSLGLPTPRYGLVEREEELESVVARVGFPCVTKPIDRGGGRGVSSGLRDLAAVRDGYRAARAHTEGPVMVESHVDGEDHRLMVVDGRLAGAFRREAPNVTGDGRRTIAELVAEQNIGRDARSLVRSGYFRPIALDASARLHLAGLGLAPESVLPPGRTVRVRSNSNISTGGFCVDVTARVHPDLRVMVETIARTMNLAMVGVDFLTTDLSESPAVSGGMFNEINTTPGLEAMTVAGWPVERAGDLALGEVPGRIPLRLLVVAEDALASALAAARACAWPAGSGWAGWDQAANSGAQLAVEAGQPWAGVQALLGHRTLARAVVIASDRQIYDNGLPADVIDSADVACELVPLWLAVLTDSSGEVRHRDPHDPGLLESVIR